MPPLSTHFRLAALVMPALGLVSSVDWFLLGTVAPDAFEPDSEESFAQHHFKGSDGRISLQSFLRETNFTHQPGDDSARAFLCGYYSHLWLDVFYRDNPNQIPFRRPAGISDADLRSLLRRETEILNAPYVLSFGSLPRLEGCLVPAELQFVNLERCVRLYDEVQSQSRGWVGQPAVFVALNEAQYAGFLRDVSKLFVEEIRTDT